MPQVYQDWMASDAELVRKSGNTAAGHCLGLPAPPSTPGGEGGATPGEDGGANRGVHGGGHLLDLPSPSGGEGGAMPGENGRQSVGGVYG